MSVLQVWKEIGEVTELIPQERISECIDEEITDVLVPHWRTRTSRAQGVRWKEAGIHNEGRVRSGWWRWKEQVWRAEGYHRCGRRRRLHQEVMNGVKVTKTVVYAVQVGQGAVPFHLDYWEQISERTGGYSGADDWWPYARDGRGRMPARDCWTHRWHSTGAGCGEDSWDPTVADQ